MPIGADVFGTRTETKNVNSLKSVETAVRYEMRRQGRRSALRWRSHPETRHFQEGDGTTSAGRRKETAEDYRYFPEPDLEPRRTGRRVGEELRGTLPRLPWLRRARIQEEWGVSDEEMRDPRQRRCPRPRHRDHRGPAHPRPRPAPGGWHTSRSRPTLAVSS